VGSSEKKDVSGSESNYGQNNTVVQRERGESGHWVLKEVLDAH